MDTTWWFQKGHVFYETWQFEKFMQCIKKPLPGQESESLFEALAWGSSQNLVISSTFALFCDISYMMISYDDISWYPLQLVTSIYNLIDFHVLRTKAKTSQLGLTAVWQSIGCFEKSWRGEATLSLACIPYHTVSPTKFCQVSWSWGQIANVAMVPKPRIQPLVFLKEKERKVSHNIYIYNTQLYVILM